MAIDWDAMVLAPMMGAEVFGEDVQPTYTAAAGGIPFQIDGIFDDGFMADNLISADGLPEFQTVDPTLGVRLSQFAVQPVSGDRVIIPASPKAGRLSDKLYFVNEVKPDGKGWAMLELTLSA